VSVKKARGKGKGTAKKSAKKSTNKSRQKSGGRSKKPVDLVQVRENINNLVRASAEEIATGVINVAKAGQLMSAKYLFEAVGLYPATEQTTARPIEHSLAHTLLTRMGLPLDPVVCHEEPALAMLPSDAKGMTEAAMPGAAEEDPEGECKDEPEPAPLKSEEQMARPGRVGGEDTVE
jgi:hypothetical protein